MPLIEAFLALALTMLSFAMVATLLVEFFHRIFLIRGRDLRLMLGEYYEHNLKEFVETELKGKVGDLEGHKKKFIERMVRNPLMAQKRYMWGKKDGGSAKEEEGLDKNIRGILPARYIFRSLVDLPTEDFLKRLAKTDIGEKIKEKSEAVIDEAVDFISLSYDEFGKVASDLFQRRARIISLIAGVCVAIVLNVNGLVILRSFLDDPVLAARVVDEAEDLKERYEASVKEGDEVKGFAGGPEIAEAAKDLQGSVEELKASGLPFGFGSNAIPEKYQPGEEGGEQAFWWLCVLGTGLLIGLGGPFWYNVVNKLMDLLRVVRGGSPKVVKPGEAEGAMRDLLQARRELFKRSGKKLLLEALGVSAAAPAGGAKGPAATDGHATALSPEEGEDGPRPREE